MKLAFEDVRSVLGNANLLRDQNFATPHADFFATKISTRPKDVDAQTIFVAYLGVSFDSHDAIPEVLAKGCRLIVCERPLHLPGNYSTLLVSSGRAAWAYLAAALAGNPQDHLKFIGVTGTNGKTSTTWIVHNLLTQAGLRGLVIGTLGASWDGKTFVTTNHTTPDPDILFPLLAGAHTKNAEFIVMEVASHSIFHKKVEPLRFCSGAFTSFSQDHLDLHKTIEEYWRVKWEFYGRLMADKSAFFTWAGIAINNFGLKPPSETHTKNYLYGNKEAFGTPSKLDFSYVPGPVESNQGTQLTVQSPMRKTGETGQIAFFGLHSLDNFLCALAISEEFIGRTIPSAQWQQVEPVPGRFEAVLSKSKTHSTNAHQPRIFVDYAHTPDALKNVLTLGRSLKPARLSVVFGCGGDRDPLKRPVMGQIAQQLADRVILTSDNPRGELPDKIISDIQKGMKISKDNPWVIADRRAAIEHAIITSTADEIIIIAGKGHETYQIIGDQKLDFDDRLVAAECINEKLG